MGKRSGLRFLMQWRQLCHPSFNPLLVRFFQEVPGCLPSLLHQYLPDPHQLISRLSEHARLYALRIRSGIRYFLF